MSGAWWAGATAAYGPVAGPAAAMLVAGLWGLARDSSMGNDEVATRWAALLSLRELAHLLRHVDAVHGLYYLIMHGWVVVGSSPTAIRVPSVISMVLAAGLAAIIGRRLTGSGWAGLFAGLIMALTPSISYYAQTARSYAMVLACVLGATLALLHALRAETADPGRPVARRWLLYAALVALGGYLNEMSLLVLAAHAVTVLLARYGRQTVRHWAAAAVGGAVLVVPLLAFSVLQHAAVSWIGRPGLASLRTLFHDYFGPSTIVGVLVLGCAVIAVWPARGAWRKPAGPTPAPSRGPELRSASSSTSASSTSAGGASAGGAAAADQAPALAWWRSGGVSLPSVAAPLLVLPAFLLLAESLVGPPLYVDRYVLYGEAGAALLAGAGAYRVGQWLSRAGWKRAVWVPGAVLCACALVLQLAPQQRIRTPQSRQYDFGGPSRYLAAHARQGDGVLFLGNFFRKAELGYPDDFRKVTDFGMAESPMQAGTFRGTDKPFSLAVPLMLTYRRIWVIGLRPSPQLTPGLLSQESIALRDHFTLVSSRHYRGIVVTLWQLR
jgi:mannosyltransferase